jgi:hypothetical protein
LTQGGSKQRRVRFPLAWIRGRAPLRLLHVVKTLDPALKSPARAMLQLAAMHQRHGHGAEVFTFDPPSVPWVRDFPLPVHVREAYAPGSICPSRYGRWLGERHGSFDAVIVHGMRGPHVRATWAALYGTRTPYFIIPQGELGGRSLFRGIREMLGWPCVLRDAAGVIFASAAEKKRAYGASILHLGKAHIIPEWTEERFVRAVTGFGRRT